MCSNVKTVVANSRPVVLSDSAAKQRTACISGRTVGGTGKTAVIG